MSGLRKQLQQVKADYESARYPGDLAAEVFARQATQSRSFWRKAAPYVAAAACVALFIGLTLRDMPGRVDIFVSARPTTPTSNETATTEVAALPDAEAIPESPTVPSDVPLVPTESVTSIPSPPSLSSMDFSSSFSFVQNQ